MTWQPIDTAPIGERILVKGPGWEADTTIHSQGSATFHDVRMTGGPMRLGVNDMTHWMTFPAGETAPKGITLNRCGEAVPCLLTAQPAGDYAPVGPGGHPQGERA